MKIPEAQKIYRANRQELIDQRRFLLKQREELEKKSASRRTAASFSLRRLPPWSFQ